MGAETKDSFLPHFFYQINLVLFLASRVHRNFIPFFFPVSISLHGKFFFFNFKLFHFFVKRGENANVVFSTHDVESMHNLFIFFSKSVCNSDELLSQETKTIITKFKKNQGVKNFTLVAR